MMARDLLHVISTSDAPTSTARSIATPRAQPSHPGLLRTQALARPAHRSLRRLPARRRAEPLPLVLLHEHRLALLALHQAGDPLTQRGKMPVHDVAQTVEHAA